MKWILRVALGIVAAMPAQAAVSTMHHAKRHHAHGAAVTYPDSVMLEGKEYKVCKRGMQDDYVEPRQAGLGFGTGPTDTYHRHP